VTHWLTTIPPIAVYLLVGLVVGIESLGIPLPGEIVLVGASVLSSRHDLAVSPFGVALAGVLGAVIGDSIGFAIGRRYGNRLFDWLGKRFPKSVNPDLIAYAEHVFARYGVLAVFGGRFIALLRILAGPLAGSLRLAYPKFLVANISGAIAWAGGTTYLVYFLGTAAESALSKFSYIALAVAVVLAVLASTLLRRTLETRVRAFAEQRGQ
jgi:membrane protein DedA with SNARE-associated domain